MSNFEEFRADLHCHSTCSDGSSSPEELVFLAKKRGLKGLSITDHDTIDAYSKIHEAVEQTGLEIITGVEFSAFHQGKSVHVLAYGFRLDDPCIIALCKRHEKRRKSRILKMLDKLQELGINISEKELFESAGSNVSSIGRPHIANVLIQKGKASSVKDAFQKFLGNGKKAFVAGDQISVVDTLQAIHQAKALAVIAHPHLIFERSLFNSLLSLNFDGLEVFYANMPRSKEANFYDIATKKKWLMTGGSDFHGENKPEIQLGASYVKEEGFRSLQRNLDELSR
ncbi:5'-3' exoribonuclease [Chlamydiales bacterium SCGC AB-751-O23]|nr:5'-3' exoribonuclease [Chlamydiales bacterium SCGC AB-751-O23]